MMTFHTVQKYITKYFLHKNTYSVSSVHVGENKAVHKKQYFIPPKRQNHTKAIWHYHPA